MNLKIVYGYIRMQQSESSSRADDQIIYLDFVEYSFQLYSHKSSGKKMGKSQFFTKFIIWKKYWTFCLTRGNNNCFFYVINRWHLRNYYCLFDDFSILLMEFNLKPLWSFPKFIEASETSFMFKPLCLDVSTYCKSLFNRFKQ